MTSGLTRFGGPRAVVCNLGTSGDLAAHQPGMAYSGTFSVTNRIGNVTAELVSATPALPDGWTLAVNQATGVVTLGWPAATPSAALPNLDFETGTANWLLGNAWIIDSAPLVDTGTQSAKYNGPGQSSIVHAQAVPVTPGTTITASARISKGTTRADFGGGAVVLEWLTAAGAPLDFSVGNVVNTGTAAFQTSTVTATAPAGAGLVRLAVSATRDIKGRASDSVYVDNVTWNHTYTLAGAPATDYAVVIRVRDGRGCQATLSQTIGVSAGVWIAFSKTAADVVYLVRSTNGVDWTGSAETIPTPPGTLLVTGVGVDGSEMIGLFSGTRSFGIRSTDLGVNWSAISFPSVTTAGGKAVTKIRGRWHIPRGVSSGTMYSDDGTTWVAATGTPVTGINAFERPGSNLLGLGPSSDNFVSTNNGQSWASSSGGVVITGVDNLSLGGDVYIKIGSPSSPFNRIARTINAGASWSSVTAPTSNVIQARMASAVGDGVVVYCNSVGEIAYSIDNGLSFSLVAGYTFPGNAEYIAFGQGRFVLTGSGGAIATCLASDPTAWVTVPSGTFGVDAVNTVVFIPPL